MDVGISAVNIVTQAFHSSNLHRVHRLLDVPCGYGRVLRHLVNLFPDAEIHGCVLDRQGVDFCHDTFGIKPIYSTEDLTQVKFDTLYDLIWVGSLFTHTSREVTQRWLQHLTRFLNDNGVIGATFHGRWCETVGKHHPYINPEAWSAIVKSYKAMGYGYRDYEKNENHSYIDGSYGISLSSASSIVKIIEAIDGVRLYSYTERAWADHQDVAVIGKPSHSKTW